MVRAIENTETASGDVPVEACVIADCGQLAPDDPALSASSTGDGDVYEDYPEDQDPVDGQDVGEKPELALRIAREVREVGNRLFKEGKFEDALHKYQSASTSVPHSALHFVILHNLVFSSPPEPTPLPEMNIAHAHFRLSRAFWAQPTLTDRSEPL